MFPNMLVTALFPEPRLFLEIFTLPVGRSLLSCSSESEPLSSTACSLCGGVRQCCDLALRRKIFLPKLTVCLNVRTLCVDEKIELVKKNYLFVSTY